MGSTIVCGVDSDDDRSRRPLEVAADLAERLHRPLVVAYVVLSAPVVRGGPEAGSGAVVGAPVAGLPYPYPIAPGEGELDDLLDDAQRRLERRLAQWDAVTAQVVVELDATAAAGHDE